MSKFIYGTNAILFAVYALMYTLGYGEASRWFVVLMAVIISINALADLLYELHKDKQ